MCDWLEFQPDAEEATPHDAPSHGARECCSCIEFCELRSCLVQGYVSGSIGEQGACSVVVLVLVVAPEQHGRKINVWSRVL